MSKKLPALKPKTVLKALLRADFYVYHQKGSHMQLRHTIKTHLRVTVPMHSRFDLPPFVVSSILDQAEINKTDFLQLLRQ
ncbi:type II toxin-antitoxin system HicA family toxin [Candidatus Parcubacteria bacterium]|nr:type II toxin-antitoxin system HicA family toxin [Candidatus Parcubacteria bacterium]